MINPFNRKKISETEKKVDERNTFLEKTFILPNGEERVYSIRAKHGFVHTFGLLPDGKVILTKQFRPGPEKVCYELPGGFLDPNETPLQGAQREFLEETGYTGNFIKIAQRNTAPYHQTQTYLFAATDCKKIADQNLDEGEFVEIEICEVRQILELIHRDDFSVTSLGYRALDWYKDFGQLF